MEISLNPQKSDTRKHLRAVGKNLDTNSSKYENFILLRNVNVEPTEDAMKEFMTDPLLLI